MSSSGSSASATPIEITCQAVQQKLAAGEAFLLLDCREPDEYATARIASAVLLPMSEIGERVAEIESKKHDLVVVHCHHGGRSLRVAMWLRNQGFLQACSMAGGIDQWSKHVDPTIPRY